MYKLSQETKDRVVYLYDTLEMTMVEVADLFPFSTKIVRKVLVGEGTTIRPKGWISNKKRTKYRQDIWDQSKKIGKLYLSKENSPRQIAKQLGCSPLLITQILKATGVKMRTLEEARRCRKDKYGSKREIKVERKRWQSTIEVNNKMSVQELRNKELTIDEISDITGIPRVEVFEKLQQ